MKRGKAIVALLVVLGLGVAFGLHVIVDPDLFQQVAVGRAILNDPASIGISSFTHTYPGFAYIEDKWLASVMVAVVDDLGGHDGLMLYQILLSIIAALAWYVMLRAWDASRAIAVAGTAAILAACAFRLESRPDTWSHALLATMIALTSRRWSLRTVGLCVVALTVFWVNLHGYFINGLLVLLAATAAAVLGERVPALGEAGSRWRRGAVLLLAGVAAGAVHPQGVHALVWPIRQVAILWREPALKQAIQEFFPTADLLEGAHAGHWILFAATLLVACAQALRVTAASPGVRLAIQLAVGASLWAFPPPGLGPWPYRVTAVLFLMALLELAPAVRERRYLAALLFVGFSVMAVPMVRNLSLVPPTAMLILAPGWSRIVREWLAAPSRPAARRVFVAVAVATIVAAVGWARLADRLAPGTYRFPAWTGWGVAEYRFPVGAADLIEREALPDRLLNNFDTSGYLLYRFHPRRAAFIADNTSIYPASFLRTYREEIMAGGIAPEAIHREFGVRTAVLDHAAMETPALLSRLSQSPSWALVYLDRCAAIFVRRDETTEDWIRRRAFDLERTTEALASESPSRSPLPGWLRPRRRLFPELNLGIFLRAVGRPDLALVEADRLWAAGPESEIATFSAAAAEEAGRLEQAIPRLEAAIEEDARSEVLGSWLARALFKRAVNRMVRGDLTRADEDLRRSALLAPEEPGAPLARARIALLRAEPDQARVLLGRALALDPRGEVRRAAERDPELSLLLPDRPNATGAR